MIFSFCALDRILYRGLQRDLGVNDGEVKLALRNVANAVPKESITGTPFTLTCSI